MYFSKGPKFDFPAHQQEIVEKFSTSLFQFIQSTIVSIVLQSVLIYVLLYDKKFLKSLNRTLA